MAADQERLRATLRDPPPTRPQPKPPPSLLLISMKTRADLRTSRSKVPFMPIRHLGSTLVRTGSLFALVNPSSLPLQASVAPRSLQGRSEVAPRSPTEWDNPPEDNEQFPGDKSPFIFLLPPLTSGLGLQSRHLQMSERGLTIPPAVTTATPADRAGKAGGAERGRRRTHKRLSQGNSLFVNI